MSANTVHVKNISQATSEKEIKDFFSFCGKITNIEVTPSGETKSATVTFEKETAAKTALLLDNTQLGTTQVSVASATGSDDFEHSHIDNSTRDSDEITQEEKPRSRIIAEYLAHGYVIGDVATQRAIDLDSKHGVSERFLKTLHGLDTKYAATDKAKTVDQNYGVTKKATNAVNTVWGGLSSYYEKAAGTPTGQKLVNFYTQQSRQVQDIHAEARRLADLKKKEAGGAEAAAGIPATTGSTTCKCGSDAKECPCAPGKCDCANCAKNVSATGTGAVGMAATLEKVPGSEKTKCACGGNDGVCACKTGECACSGCSK